MWQNKKDAEVDQNRVKHEMITTVCLWLVPQLAVIYMHESGWQWWARQPADYGVGRPLAMTQVMLAAALASRLRGAAGWVLAASGMMLWTIARLAQPAPIGATDYPAIGVPAAWLATCALAGTATFGRPLVLIGVFFGVFAGYLRSDWGSNAPGWLTWTSPVASLSSTTIHRSAWMFLAIGAVSSLILACSCRSRIRMSTVHPHLGNRA
jgi:hypothetical protein